MDFFSLLLVLGIIASGASASMPAEGFEDNPLWCDGRIPECPPGTCLYTTDKIWGAFPIRWYEEGIVGCGQWWIVQRESDGRIWIVQALDASKLHVRESYLGVPFVVELPEHMGVGTVRVTVVNLTRLEEISPYSQ